MAILIVDDDQAIRDTLAELFALEGYAARTAQDGVDALAQIEAEPPELVVLDLLMPRMGGVELMERLREDPEWAKIPIVLSTSDPQRAPTGATILTKPVDVARLLQVVEARRRSSVP